MIECVFCGGDRLIEQTNSHGCEPRLGCLDCNKWQTPLIGKGENYTDVHGHYTGVTEENKRLRAKITELEGCVEDLYQIGFGIEIGDRGKLYREAERVLGYIIGKNTCIAHHGVDYYLKSKTPKGDDDGK